MIEERKGGGKKKEEEKQEEKQERSGPTQSHLKGNTVVVRVLAELLGEVRVVRVEGLLLETALDNHARNLALLLPGEVHVQELLETIEKVVRGH